MSLRRGVINGALSLGSVRVFASVLNAVGILILARLLVPADFGIVAIATSIMSVVMSMTEASLRPALVQLRTPTRAHLDTVWTMSVIRAVLIFAVIGILSIPLASLYGDDSLVPVFLIAGLTGAFMDLSNPRITLATRDLRFAPLVIFQLAQKSISLGSAIALALILQNFWGIILGNCIGAILSSTASYLVPRYLPRFSLEKAAEVWRFSGWMFLNQLCETLNWRFDQLAIGLAESRTQFGYYSVADNLAVMPSRELSMPLLGALFPGFARLGDDRIKLRKAFVNAQSGVVMLTAPAAVGLALLAEPAVHVLLGDQWASTVPLVQLLAIGYALDTVGTTVHPLGMAMGETKTLFVRQLAILAIRIPLIVAGLLLGGLVGAAAGRVLSSVGSCLINFIAARKLLDVSVWKQVRAHEITVFGVIAMVAVVMGLQTYFAHLLLANPMAHLFLLALAGAVTFGFSVLGMWSLAGRKAGPVTDILELAARFPGLSAAAKTGRT